jgi:hypothetical protein
MDMILSVSCHVSRVSNTWDQHCFGLPNLLQRIGLVLQTHGSNSSPRLLANFPKHGKRLWWWRSECASICPSPTVEVAQTPHIGMTWMWYTVWNILQPQPLRSGMVCTPTSPRLSANSPKSGETSVVVTEWICIHMSIHNSWRCSNPSYRYDMDVGCSVKGSTASTIV